MSLVGELAGREIAEQTVSRAAASATERAAAEEAAAAASKTAASQTERTALREGASGATREVHSAPHEVYNHQLDMAKETTAAARWRALGKPLAYGVGALGLGYTVNKGVDALERLGGDVKDAAEDALHASEEAARKAEEEAKRLLAAGKKSVGNAVASVGGGVGVARVAESVLAIAAIGGVVYVAYEGYRFFKK